MNATALKHLRVTGRDGSPSRPSAPARPRRGEQALVALYHKREFHRRRRRHDPREARPEGSQFRGTGWIAQVVHPLGLATARHSGRTGCRRRRFGGPMLVFNMSVFNSANSRECIFNSLPQRENVWS